MKKRVVLFDLDDTLNPEIQYVASGQRAVARVAEERFGANYEDVLGVMLAADNAFDALHGMLPQMGVQEMLQVYRNHMPDICLSESSLGVLKELRAYGCGLGIITDGRSIGQRNKLKALGLDDMMDYVSVSEEIKADKLSSYPFQRAIDYFGDDCSYVYIGDNPAKDFMHPNAMGWHTMMLKESSPGMNVHPQGLTDIGHLCRPDIVITDICEVADIVRRL